MIKKLITLTLVLLLFTQSLVLGEGAEKYQSMPEIFKTEIEEVSQKLDNNERFVYKEYLHTTNEAVNTQLKNVVDAFDNKLSPLLEKDPTKNAYKYSRLDINTVFYRTGNSYISTLIIAQSVYRNEQRGLEFSAQTYKLEDGTKLNLTDMFNDKAWPFMAKRIEEHFNALFPNDTRNNNAINNLCSIDNIKEANFTLSGMELTLHFYENKVFENRNNIAHVRFYYPELKDMFTEKGLEATDNSRWKMVAITCDDGPKNPQSTYALNAFRKIGARANYFIVGKMLKHFSPVLRRQFDQNHIFGNHSLNHWSGYSMKTPTRRLKEVTDVDLLTYDIIGERLWYFRAPGGTYPPWMEAFLDMPIIQWSLDTYDYTGKNKNRILASIKQNIKEYDIILCHDTGYNMHKAIPLIGNYFEENGYMLVTLDELKYAQNVTLINNEVYWSFRPDENSEGNYNINDTVKK